MKPRASTTSAGASTTGAGAGAGAGASKPGAGASKTGAAALSVASNSALILLKAIAGTVTGSVALLTEALHSATDLIASIVALFSVRAADVPADESHPYGHEKIEDMAAAIEGVLILVGCVVIAFEAVRHLIEGTGVQRLGIGIAVLALSIAVNFFVSRTLSRRAAATGSPALAADAAHLSTDMLSSAGVLVALCVVAFTGWDWLDPVIALVVAAVVAWAGVRILTRSSRVLVDETLPDPELDAIREVVAAFAERGIVGFHELRGRQAGARRHVDLHVQFRAGTTLEDAHRTAHQLQDAIRERLGDADVLIHLEPEDRVRPGEEVTAGEARRG
jgi:cation diffusion facilitator family transporter